MTWEELLTELRADLKDEGATPRWSDRLLWIYAKDAIRDYSTWFPRRIDRVLLQADAVGYRLPADYLEDLYLEAPLGVFHERQLPRPGQKLSRHGYYLSGGKLYTEATAPLYLTYYALHPVPASESDLDFVLSVPDGDIELLRLYVKAKAFGQMRGRQAALDRFKEEGRRNDNPVHLETVDLYEEYLRAISVRIRGGVQALYRTGRLA